MDHSSSEHSTRHFTHWRIYPWLVILLCAFFLFYKYVLQISPSVMTSKLMSEFHLDGFGLGNLAAVFFYAYMATQLFVGVLLDRFSVRWICALAIFMSAAGAIGFGYAITFWQAAISRGLMGFGAAFATVCYLKSAAVWFKPRQYAFISGLLATAAMVGAICGQAPFAYLVTFLNWRGTLYFAGGVGVTIAILFALVVRDTPKAQPFVAVSGADKHEVKLADVFSILKKPQNWLLMLYSGLTFSPVAVFGGLWGASFLQVAYHFSDTESASLVSLIFFGLAVGGPVLGWLSDQIQRRKLTMVLGNCLSLMCLLAVVYVSGLPEWVLGVLLFGFGFGVGAFMLGFTVGKELNPLPLAATVVALINTGDAIFGAVTEPLVGHFLDLGALTTRDGHAYFSVVDYYNAFIPLPEYLLVATLLLVFIRDSKGKQCRT